MRLQVGDQSGGGMVMKSSSGVDAVEAGRQGHVELPLAIGVIERKSISAPTANPGTFSEPSAIRSNT